MSIPLTHATVRGLAALRGAQWRSLPSDVAACDNQYLPALGSWGTVPADLLHATIPTCPRCAVLRDAALEGREVTL
jgi:hypothetical protein